MRSAEKHVLFVQHKHGGKVAMYPVSVHANARTAAPARAALSNAVKSGDKDAALKLAPSLKLAEDGALPTDVKYAIVVLPYEPVTETPASDVETFEF